MSFADPFDDELRSIITQAVDGKGVLEGENAQIHGKGTLVCMGTSIPHVVYPELTIFNYLKRKS